MRGLSTPHSVDEVIAALAGQQHGVVGRRQLLDLGLDVSAIDRRVASGRLLVVHRGVYAVGHRSLRREGWCWAAVLGGGAGTVLSHFTAAALWNLMSSRSVIHISVPGRTGRLRLGDVVAHRPRSLPADEVEDHDGLPVTTVARTLVDLAAVARENDLEHAVEQAERQSLFDLVAVQAVLARSHGRRGIRTLRDVILRWAGPGVTRSEMEIAFRAICRRVDLPMPLTNAAVLLDGGHYEPDFLWPDRRLIVETDGFATHKTKRAFVRDRRRDRRLHRADYAVERFSWDDIFFDPRGCGEEMIDIMARNPRRQRMRGVD